MTFFKLELSAGFWSRMHFLLKPTKANCCNILTSCLLDLWILWNFNNSVGEGLHQNHPYILWLKVCISTEFSPNNTLPSSRCRDKHYYYHERKNLVYAFVLPFSYPMFAIIIEISIWKRTKESFLEVTLYCLFLKRSFSRVLRIISLKVTL